MDDDGKKEENQASTSKKEKNEHDEYDQRDDTRNFKDDRSYTSGSSLISSPRSRLEIRADNRQVEGGTKVGSKRDKDERKEKRKKVRRGRVNKRKRSPVRRQYHYNAQSKRTFKRKPPKTQLRTYRDSVSTIFTRLSSHSSGNLPNCQYCGHRCCGRRIGNNTTCSKEPANGGKNTVQHK